MWINCGCSRSLQSREDSSYGCYTRYCENSPKGRRSYELADGSELQMDITTADIEFMGEIVGGTIIMGAPGREPILGVTALESVGIDVDLRNQTLKRLPAVRLKKLRAKFRG
jgi:hypothetical protein